MKKAYMILDLQYGSTGKGSLAGYLAYENQPDVVVTAWGPNAGHTYIDPDGRTYIHRMLANGVVSPKLKQVLIGPGSVIDENVLLNEILFCQDHLTGKRIIIHPHACVVTPEHLETEKRNVKIGSTMKGTGAAVIQRIERDPDHMNTAIHAISADFVLRCAGLGIPVSFCADEYRAAINNATVLQIEGAQGFSLSIYHGAYPYTTSRDVTPAQVIADCAIPWGVATKTEVYGTLRTFPIRVSNRKTENGEYTSGPCYRDQKEIKWGDIGLEPELTTVTKLPRRIFTFSYLQLEQAAFQCAPSKIFLNFANYLKSEVELFVLIDQIETMVGAEVAWVGVGPKHTDVYKQHELTEELMSKVYEEKV